MNDMAESVSRVVDGGRHAGAAGSIAIGGGPGVTVGVVGGAGPSASMAPRVDEFDLGARLDEDVPHASVGDVYAAATDCVVSVASMEDAVADADGSLVVSVCGAAVGAAGEAGGRRYGRRGRSCGERFSERGYRHCRRGMVGMAFVDRRVYFDGNVRRRQPGVGR